MFERTFTERTQQEIADKQNSECRLIETALADIDGDLTRVLKA